MRWISSEKTSRQGAYRGTGSGGGGGFDQIGHAFRLGEIELAVEKGASGEFAGFGQTRTEDKAAFEQQAQHHRSAVALEFEHVFAGK